jgi:hypothetical protein
MLPLYIKLIRRYTYRPIQFSKLDPSIQEIQYRCLICLDDFNARSRVTRINGCRHFFHRRCLDQWVKEIMLVDCPICRNKPYNNKRRRTILQNDEYQDVSQSFLNVLRNLFIIIGIAYIFTIVIICYIEDGKRY